MKFHWPSFVLGYGAGLATQEASRRLRPVLLAVASNAYRFADALVARLVMQREAVEDFFAEARARARGAAGERELVH
jgi:hypothetical protein